MCDKIPSLQLLLYIQNLFQLEFVQSPSEKILCVTFLGPMKSHNFERAENLTIPIMIGITFW